MSIREKRPRKQRRAGRFWKPTHNLPWSRVQRINIPVLISGKYNNNQVGTWPACGLEPDKRSVSALINVSNVVTFGGNYPGYKERLRRHLNTTTSMRGTKYHFRRVVNSGHFHYRWIATHVCDSGTYDGAATAYHGALYMPTMGGFLGFSPDPDALNQADSRLLNSYLSATKDWRGGNFAAELKETVDMLLHPVRSIYKRTWVFVGKLGKLKRVFTRDPVAYSKALADMWLSYSFGIKPLVNDMNDFAVALTKFQSGYYVGDIERVGGHGYKRTSLVQDSLDVSSQPYGIGGLVSNRTVTRDSHVFYKGAVHTAPTFGGRTLTEFGFDVFDVIPAIWEAIPLSFLFDYFLNVQEVLDSMRLMNASVAWLQRTVRNTVTLNITPPVQTAASKTQYEFSFSDPGFYSSATVVDRGPLLTIPYPGWQFKIPGFQSLRWLNVAALARQFAGTKPLHSQDVSSVFK